MDINSFNSDEPKFSVETVSFGRIDVLPLTVRRMEALGDIDSDSASSFVSQLIATIARKADGSELAKLEAEQLTESERETFIQTYLDQNPDLFRESIMDRRKDEQGKTIVSFRNGEIKYPREEGEVSDAYLFRLFKKWLADRRESAGRLMDSFKGIFAAHKTMFTPPFLESFRKTQSSVAQLQDMVKKLRPIAFEDSALNPLAFPKRPTLADVAERALPDGSALDDFHNPIHDTNDKLSEVVDQLDQMGAVAAQMGETVGNVSESISKFLVAFGAAADKADRSSRRAVMLAVAAIVIGVVSTLGQVVYSDWRSREDQAATDEAVAKVFQGIDGVVSAQRESAQQLSAQLGGNDQAIAGSIERLTAAIDGLSRSLPRPEPRPASQTKPASRASSPKAAGQ